MTEKERIAVLTDALYGALNLESAAKAGARHDTYCGVKLDVEYHMNKIRKAIKLAGCPLDEADAMVW